MTLVEVSVKMSFFVEGFAAKRTSPLRGSVLLFGRVLGRENVACGVEGTLQWQLYLEICDINYYFSKCVVLL